jgi:hypothetical protein
LYGITLASFYWGCQARRAHADVSNLPLGEV